MNLNKVIIAGRLTADPEMKSTKNGTGVCMFSIAVNKYAKGENKAEFISCRAWKDKADFLVRYFRKGNPIYVEGFLENVVWNGKDGEKRIKTEVTVTDIQFILSRAEAEKDIEQNTVDAFSEPQDADDAELPF